MMGGESSAAASDGGAGGGAPGAAGGGSGAPQSFRYTTAERLLGGEVEYRTARYTPKVGTTHASPGIRDCGLCAYPPPPARLARAAGHCWHARRGGGEGARAARIQGDDGHLARVVALVGLVDAVPETFFVEGLGHRALPLVSPGGRGLHFDQFDASDPAGAKVGSSARTRKAFRHRPRVQGMREAAMGRTLGPSCLRTAPA
mmetsp:Transcript_26036/g.83079  ORF Transcript_26036/g.83079 Transcript_26036/m.83079 type:complete len:202 (+) Transcript_26036:321-926(+)